MFWRMAGLSTASPVETILDKGNFTLEELLDEDEIIQECKALNGRLINFLREKIQVEQLVRYIVLETPEDSEKKRTFKFPFIACEIFTCEVDIILKTLVEDEELMDLLFSFLESKQSHSTMLAGYFSKVVICLLLRKTVPFMNYIKAHPEILSKLVDLIGITSIMEVLIRLIGADEHIYTNYTDAMQWIEETDVLEMIVDKFSSSDLPEVHANTAEALCAITRFAPSGLTTKISSPNFIGRLFRHALEESRPKSVLVNSLTICISLLDPKRLAFGAYQTYSRQMSHGATITASPETIEGMLESLGHLLKLLDVSSSEGILSTTYGKLQPPLGKHRLKIVEFISVLMMAGTAAAEKELIRLGAIQKILDLFFVYPFNNFLHHHVENIIFSCLESFKPYLIEHLLRECNLVKNILEAEKNFTLAADSSKPTVPAEGRSPPRIGNIGHMTRISNKLLQLANNNSEIQAYLQDNNEWMDWHTNVLAKRNALENVYQWTCGRPTALQDRRDSDDDDYQDRDYDVAALANNLSQAFRYGIYSNDDIEEVHGSLERDDEDVYFDDESAEVVISSLRLGDDQESGSLFSNSNWFALEDDKVADERAAGTLTSSSPDNDVSEAVNAEGIDDEVIVGEDEDLDDTASSSPEPTLDADEDASLTILSKDLKETEIASDKPTVWVEWRETPDSNDPSHVDVPRLPNGEFQLDSGDDHVGGNKQAATEASSSDPAEGSPKPASDSLSTSPLSKPDEENPSTDPVASDEVQTVVRDVETSDEAKTDVGDVETSDEAKTAVSDVETSDEPKTAVGDVTTSDEAKTAAGDVEASDEAKTAAGDFVTSDEAKTVVGDVETSDKAKTAAGDVEASDEAKTVVGDVETSDEAKTAVGAEEDEVTSVTKGVSTEGSAEPEATKDAVKEHET